MTRLTSLVAVDKTPSRPQGEPLKVSELPINLPAGWDFAKVFGERPQLPATPTERRADADDARLQVAALKRAQPAVTQMPDTVKLPKTATDAELKMIAGVILLTVSLILFGFNRSTSDVTALTSAERRRPPPPPLSRARAASTRPPRAARAAFSYDVIPGDAKHRTRNLENPRCAIAH